MSYGKLNVFVGDRMRVDITGAFGVPGENDNGRRLISGLKGFYVWMIHMSSTPGNLDAKT